MKPVNVRLTNLWARDTWPGIRRKISDPVCKAVLASTPNFMHHVEGQLRAAIETLILKA